MSGRKGGKKTNLMLESKKHKDKVDLDLESTFHPNHLILTFPLLKEMPFSKMTAEYKKRHKYRSHFMGGWIKRSAHKLVLFVMNLVFCTFSITDLYRKQILDVFGC